MTIYIRNLMEQEERLEPLLRQFRGEEFDINLIGTNTCIVDEVKFWNSIKKSLKSQVKKAEDFIIVCGSIHQFTSEYSHELLINSIESAKTMNAHILAGGISAFSSAIQVSENLFWVEKFSGLQFIIIFKKFFKIFLNSEFRKGDVVDYRLCSLTNSKYFIYPFISIERDTSHFDLTFRNNTKNKKSKTLKQCRTKVRAIKQVAAF